MDGRNGWDGRMPNIWLVGFRIRKASLAFGKSILSLYFFLTQEKHFFCLSKGGGIIWREGNANIPRSVLKRYGFFSYGTGKDAEVKKESVFFPASADVCGSVFQSLSLVNNY